MLALNGVEVAATHALEGNVTLLRLETRVVATIVIDPQAEEERGDEETIDDRGGDEIHARGRKDGNAGGDGDKQKGVGPGKEPTPESAVVRRRDQAAGAASAWAAGCFLAFL